MSLRLLLPYGHAVEVKDLILVYHARVVLHLGLDRIDLLNSLLIQLLYYLWAQNLNQLLTEVDEIRFCSHRVSCWLVLLLSVESALYTRLGATVSAALDFILAEAFLNRALRVHLFFLLRR